MTATPSLRYYPDKRPGITRQRCGRGFTYFAQDGTRITDKAERARLNALAVPPAYENVWICPFENGHLQATGYDPRGRKQYRYHPAWSAAQSQTKFAGLADFGAALPRLRRAILRDLHSEAGAQRFALAAAVAMIDRLSLRVGNPEYTKTNGSFGTLTLKGQHVRLRDDKLEVSFRAKGGKRVRRQIADKTLLRVLGEIRELPGAELLAWLGTDGTPHTLTSAALNDYIAERSGTDGVTAKTFRTWSGTVAAFKVAMQTDAPRIKDMAEAAAERLNNTPTIARSSYIHPDVLDLCTTPQPLPQARSQDGLTQPEQRLLAFLNRDQEGLQDPVT
ncbi:hypothetical protein NTA49_09120 [Photobacterium sp. TY 1-4]|uniref:DNA topoisomerase n=2 Tax=Pseudosulfitobacter koreensis TaxID=2968472 RepID=A0ABT1Z0M7_9RHOB|nr:hypothetical protein [Pseudosulfitobacter koreense]